MDANSGALTQSLKEIVSQFQLGLVSLKPDAVSLLGLLAVLELTIAALWWGFSGNEALGKFLKKCLLFGFFIWVVENYNSLIGIVLKGFVESGTKAGGGGRNYMDDPSAIIDQGFNSVMPLLDLAVDMASSWDLFDALLCLICLLITFLSFVVLAAQVFITRIEFALVSTLGFILLPFGVFKQTAFMAEKVFGAVFTFGVKMMVLAFLVAVCFPLLLRYQLPTNPDWGPMLSLMAVALTYAVLALRAPGVASAIISGAPSLGTAAVGAAAAVGAGAIGAGAAVLGGVASAAGGVALKGISAAASMAGGKAGGESAGGLASGAASMAAGGGGAGSGGGANGGASSKGQNGGQSGTQSSNSTSNESRQQMKNNFADSLGKESSQGKGGSSNSRESSSQGDGAMPQPSRLSRIANAGKEAASLVKDGIEKGTEKSGNTIAEALREDGQAGPGVNVPLRASNDD